MNGITMAPKARRKMRPILRQATLILPSTGERVKRRVTLRDPATDGSNDDNLNDSEVSPLLGQHTSKSTPTSWQQRTLSFIKNLIKNVCDFVRSKTGQGVLKCSLAYLLGSMATFVPIISNFLGQQDGKHMVATITVYFHPARSQGSMFEAVLLALLAFVYAAFISFTSMGVSVFFGRTLDLIVVGHIIVLIVFCGGGLGLVGWVKQRLGNPLVNVACSLTSLAIITVLTKEGSIQASTFSDDKVMQVMKMVIMGVICTTAICFLVNPISARKELKENVIEVTDSFADMLTLITRSFLSGMEEDTQQQSYTSASTRYRKVLGSLSKNLKEAKYEHYVMGTEDQYYLEAKLVTCMQRLAQSIGGLRSAATTQFALLDQVAKLGASTPVSSSFGSSFMNETSSVIDALSQTPPESYGILTSIEEDPEDDEFIGDEDSKDMLHMKKPDYSNLPTVHSPVEIFERFIMHLGPSMKSLAFTLREILEELPYGPAPDFKIAVNSHFRSSLTEAIQLFSKSRKEALGMLYKNKELHKQRPIAIEADFEEVAASCGHFSFSLQDFAEEMRRYLDILDDLKSEIDERPGGRSWRWLKIWQSNRPLRGLKRSQDPERDSIITQSDSASMSAEAPNSLEHKTPFTFESGKPVEKLTFTYRVWKVLRIFHRDDIKFAIKVGVGAALYALPSFLYSTRPFYQHWRGEWGLLSYMLVCSMTIGASNTTGMARFLGTCVGAICAIITWIASRGNGIALATFGWAMSYWTSYIIVAKGNGPVGRFIMLTYNLSALYAYSLSVRDEEFDEDEGGLNPNISEIALHRALAVLSGCLWGLIVTRLVWPISARSKFKDGLSLLWLRMGLVWKRDPLVSVADGESLNAHMNFREEFELNSFVSQLEKLRGSAAAEFELRGPFPDREYEAILKSTSRMLDSFHGMNVVIMKNLTASEGEERLLKHTAGQRAHLCSRISHLFQVLASSMKLEFPLNEALPNTDNARDRLLANIFAYRREEKVAQGTSDEDFATLYAYVLVTGQISAEIQDIGRKLEDLFGVLDADRLKLQ